MVRLYPEPMRRDRALTDEELEKLLDCSPQPLRAAILIGYFQGLRKGEIQNLRWQDIDLKNELITIRSTKIGESRILPLAPIVVEELKSLPRSLRTDHILLNTKNGDRLGNFRKAWDTTLRRAGISNFRFHDLRHSFVSRKAMEGYSTATIKAFTGHKSIRTLERYAHISDSHLREAISGLKLKELRFNKEQK